MTDKNYTHIAMLSDRSGSMTSIQQDAQGGINTFIKDQAKEPGKCTLTLLEFDTVHDVVYDGVDIHGVPDPAYTLVPRGGTALNDAMHFLITRTGEFLNGLPEDERPGVVLFAVMTDGGENSSHDYSAEDIKALVQEHTDKYAWTFTFLAANIDAFATGSALGFSAANTIAFAAAGPQTAAVYSSLSSNTSLLRSSVASGGPAKYGYSDEDRENASKTV